MDAKRTPVEQVVIMMQRAKTFMESTGIQVRYWDAYERLSHAIHALERAAHLSAPALRDEEDGC